MFHQILKCFSRGVSSEKLEVPPQVLVDGIIGTLNQEHLGYGCDVHSESEHKHWPPAYALLASAELSRSSLNKINHNSACFDRAVNCAKWLLDNVGCASTGGPLWTLPYPRKIWEDEIPVKENTAFCVPTCQALQAMHEFAVSPIVDDALRSRAKEAAVNGANYFANNCFDKTDSGIVFWYSSLKQHSFHVTNASALMGGQLQRVSTLCKDCSGLNKLADMAINQLLAIKFQSDGALGWNYFGEKIPKGKTNKTNDFLHEAFVCHGLMDYKLFGGSLGCEYEYEDLYRTLGRFYKDGKFYEFSSAECANSRKHKKARVLAIGHALYVATKLENLMGRADGLSAKLFASLCKEYLVDRRLYYRPGGQDVTHRVRVVAHVVLGLTEYSINYK
ncbi:MAG TPA: hypothetical protein EYO01_00825 [Phycisphaerales bacterium]|nr:hypothetical protein [Phycisphaerales bacterium]HIB00729.1 hypothetical protein [Phycisphaerales bacterium]HIB50413.1 hypothetical protein [Phycisphaerales bacterium]HIO23411.1 hypothetical protein [Nitrospinaceae bacterium]